MSLGNGGHEPSYEKRPRDDEDAAEVRLCPDGDEKLDHAPQEFDDAPQEFDDAPQEFDDAPQEFDEADDGRWPLSWHGLAPTARWHWFMRLWSDVCSLSARYRLSVRSEWWADELQVEVLAAFAAWVRRYDSGEWDDPPGKLALLFDLERVAAALRDGIDPFNAERDRPAFERYLQLLGCQPPPRRDPGQGSGDGTIE